MKFTQGVLKYCQIYGITFDNKYSDIKSIVATDNYSSKFLSNNAGQISQTSTILSDSNVYYNAVEECKAINCNVENGTFINSILLGLSGISYINDGFFSACTFTNYIVNGGKFYDCVIDSTNVWNYGHWDNSNGNNDFTSIWNGGVWNSGPFIGIWTGGTFNGGIFQYPGSWYDGIANGGVFSGITWYNGLARNAYFGSGCTFIDGIFNDGYFIDSTFLGGNFNGGIMSNSIISGGTIYNGIISNCIVDGDTEIRGGKFTNVTIRNGNIFNIDASYISVDNGNFYSGNYSNVLFNGGNIYNGMYINITGATSSLTIHNGTFKKSIFDTIIVENGNFANCIATGITWLSGIYTDGTMYNCFWYDGYWNDGLFYAGDCYTMETSNTIIVSGVICQLEAVINCNVVGPSTTTTTTTAFYYYYNVEFSTCPYCVYSTDFEIKSTVEYTIGDFFLFDDVGGYGVGTIEIMSEGGSGSKGEYSSLGPVYISCSQGCSAVTTTTTTGIATTTTTTGIATTTTTTPFYYYYITGYIPCASCSDLPIYYEIYSTQSYTIGKYYNYNDTGAIHIISAGGSGLDGEHSSLVSPSDTCSDTCTS